ncbi:myeloid differentiation primary response protein MyD88 [Chelonus insularis]|uniref:myeloid differentiation primary response protein MyD88 n=1 Tax=Chelonus insularis TaxID=460826 RepID=UPI00158B8D62|nr:myeloid differentiation primary response protein MyD88 [Chelonus insularis]XP_034938035.1 myeloid differentiation primary response protein MyD88 [Chelonus insularis]
MVDMSTVPLVALSQETRFLLSTLLNPIKALPTSDGKPRDWRGLADLFLIGGEMIPSIVTSPDPTGCLLELVKNSKYTLKDFQNMLENISRWDVIDDSELLFEKDAEQYFERMERNKESADVFKYEVDNKMLTIDDLYRVKAGLKTQHYDAFLLCADEDFTELVINNLEQKYNLKLCIKDRDLISGITFEHEAIMELISERCNRLLVVISPNFLKSPENKFFLNYAQALSIEKRQRKVIPCLYKECDIPSQLRYTFILNYNKPHLYEFWKRLNESIETVKSDLPVKSNSCEEILKGSTDCDLNKCDSTLDKEESDKETSSKAKLFFKTPQKRVKQSSVPDNKSSNNQDNPIMNLPSLEGLDSLESTSVNLDSPKKNKKKKTFKAYKEKIKCLVGNKS